MKSFYVEMLMGHREALVKSYMRPKDTDVISEFMMHAADVLTVDPTQRLMQENQDLKSGQAQEIAQLKAQLEDKEQQLRQTVEALEKKSKNSIDKIEKQILKLNDMIVEVTTDHEHGGTHYYKFKKA